MFQIIISIVLLIIIFVYIILYNKETFVIPSEDIYIIAENSKNVAESSMRLSSKDYKRIINGIKESGTVPKDMILYVDPYIDYYELNNRNYSRDYEEGIFLCLYSNNIGLNECIWDWEGKTIAYNYTSDYLFIKAIINGYRLDETKIKIVQISDDDLMDMSVSFDYFITYVVRDSKYMKFIKNSKYFINGFKDVDIHRLLPFYPFIKENYKSVVNYFPDDDIKTYINGENNVLIPIMKYKIRKYIVEGFITRLEMPYDYFGDVSKKITEYSTKSIDYECYGNSIVNNKYECDSLYNIDGSRKIYYSKWDKKCERNEECPYYKSNKNYPNSRGGCNNGFCEFPVGIKRIGFTKYDDTGMNTPLCYNCPDMRDFECCKKKQNPDYVFSYDFRDRVRNNMTTIISKISE